ncbi:TolC family protein [Novosphingobium sp. SG707]|uniref:TolC family protein n=1 Tax=Novosphingobium sp. SG707 TaxID=2586996 RepID=UPI0014452772|nr:outer membrane protein TolC [Novosphingobium sp. SG707]
MIRAFMGMALALAAPAAGAAELTLKQVLASSAAHAPQILEAVARQKQADARLLSTQGLYDLVFDGDVQWRALGYYDNAAAEAKATRPLTSNGGNYYAGYRLSMGPFPSYDGKSVTNSLGEVKVGAVFSLLRDRLIDERRGRMQIAGLDTDLAEMEREMVAVGVQRRAIEAYQQWVAAGQRLRIYQDLLELASARQASIEKQVKAGARQAMLVVENQQNIVRRQSLLVRAQQDLAIQANALSLFWRNEEGQPIVPGAEDLPAALPRLAPPLGQSEEEAIKARPDMQMLMTRLAQASARSAMARNELRPRLDLRVEGSKDIGDGGPMGYVRRPAEAIVGLRFTMPLEQRQARGKIAEAAAETDALVQRRRLLEQQLSVEIANLKTQVTGSDKLAHLAHDEAGLAARMAEAERRRFSLGASDFLLVNLREEAAADARLRQVDAEYRVSASRAELAASLVDRGQLGLE